MPNNSTQPRRKGKQPRNYKLAYDNAVAHWPPLLRDICATELTIEPDSYKRCYQLAVKADRFLTWCRKRLKVTAYEIEKRHIVAYLDHYRTHSAGAPRWKKQQRPRPQSVRSQTLAINWFMRGAAEQGSKAAIEYRKNVLHYGDYSGVKPPTVEMILSEVAGKSITAAIATGDVKALAKAIESEALVNGLSETHSRTLRQHTVAFDAFMSKQGKSLVETGPEDITAYVRYLQIAPGRNGRPRRMNTIRKRFAEIRTVFRFLERAGAVPKNPTADLKGPRGMTTFVPPPPDEDVGAAIKSAAISRNPELSARNVAILTLLAYTGMRRSELARLNRQGGEVTDSLVLDGKGAKQRIVGVHPVAASAVNEYLAFRSDSDPALFLDQNQNPIKGDAIGRCVTRVARRLGIKLTPHDFRRWYFHQMALAGHPWFTIQAAGGWSTQVAAMRYIHAASATLGVKAQQTFDPISEGRAV